MNFGELVDATNTVRRENRVVVVVNGKEYDLAEVEVATVDLDEGKSAKAVADGSESLEGHGHEGAVVRLTAG